MRNLNKPKMVVKTEKFFAKAKRSHSPPFKGRGRGGVCIFFIRRILETPPLTPPLASYGFFKTYLVNIL